MSQGRLKKTKYLINLAKVKLLVGQHCTRTTITEREREGPTRKEVAFLQAEFKVAVFFRGASAIE